MTDYIREIQRQFVEVYGFPAAPDGEYPMMIDGKLDRVRVKDGRISCCNFGPEPDAVIPAAPPAP